MGIEEAPDYGAKGKIEDIQVLRAGVILNHAWEILGKHKYQFGDVIWDLMHQDY